MPPKKTKEQQAAEKSRLKEKSKLAEDKTFGLKNKNKSKQVQAYCKQIQASAVNKGSHADIQNEHSAAKKKEMTAQQNALMNSLFNLATDKKGRGFDAKAKSHAKEKNMEDTKAGSKLPDHIQEAFRQGIYNCIQMTNAKHGVRVSEIGGSPFVAAARKQFDELEYVQCLAFIRKKVDDFWCDSEEGDNPIVRCQDDLKEEESEANIDELLEQAKGLEKEHITEITFKEWREKKRVERLKAEEDAKDKRLKAQGGPKLTGKEWFDKNKTNKKLFDDLDEGDAVEIDMLKKDKFESCDESDDENQRPKNEIEEVESPTGGSSPFNPPPRTDEPASSSQ